MSQFITELVQTFN